MIYNEHAYTYFDYIFKCVVYPMIAV